MESVPLPILRESTMENETQWRAKKNRPHHKTAKARAKAKVTLSPWPKLPLKPWLMVFTAIPRRSDL